MLGYQGVVVVSVHVLLSVYVLCSLYCSRPNSGFFSPCVLVQAHSRRVQPPLSGLKRKSDLTRDYLSWSDNHAVPAHNEPNLPVAECCKLVYGLCRLEAVVNLHLTQPELGA